MTRTVLRAAETTVCLALLAASTRAPRANQVFPQEFAGDRFIAQASGVQTLSFPGFASAAGLSLVGNAAIVSDRLRIAPAGLTQSGAAWLTTSQAVGDGFETTFQFQLGRVSGGGGDGFAFVIQNVAPTRVLVIGDSITMAPAGYNSFRRPLWQQLTSAGLLVDFIGTEHANHGGAFPDSDFDPDHEGHWGARADQIGDALPAWLGGYTPDIALIHIGTNDAMLWDGQWNFVWQTIGDILGIISALQADNPNVTIFVAKLIPIENRANPGETAWNDQIDLLNAQIPWVGVWGSTATSRVIIVDQNTGFSASAHTSDGIHPNEIGEEKMATKWFNAIVAAGGVEAVSHTGAGTSVLGGNGGGLGYRGIRNSLAVEFDTWRNYNLGDPNDNHISVHTTGVGPNQDGEGFALGAAASPVDLSDGQVHTGRISYQPGTLRVYVDNLGVPVLAAGADLGAILNLADGRAWVGFTAATFNAFEDHDILNWSFTPAALEICNDQVDNDGDGLVDAADPDCASSGQALQIGLTPNTTTGYINDPVTVTARVTNLSGTPQAGAYVWFLVSSGPNAQVNSGMAPGQGLGCDPIDCRTDNNGEVRWTYSGGGSPGSDVIESATYSVPRRTRVKAAAQRQWQTPPAPIGQGNGLAGAYYNGLQFTGQPITRVDPAINFWFGDNAPISGIQADNFSVCWLGQIQAQFSEAYTFTIVSDDGVRLWIDDRLVIDQWIDHSLASASGVITLTGNQKYNLRLEYYDRLASAGVRLYWSSHSTPYSIVPQSQLYSHGGPLALRPHFAQLPEGGQQAFTLYPALPVTWSVTGGGTIDQNGIYRSPASFAAPEQVLIRADATDGSLRHGLAAVLLMPSAQTGMGDGLAGRYYDNMDFSGPSTARLDARVDFSFDSASPDPAMGPDTFSVRWSGQVEAPLTQTYTFSVQTDDGARLWVNGLLLIDAFFDQGASLWSGTIDLVAGQKYDLALEYYEKHRRCHRPAFLEHPLGFLCRRFPPADSMPTEPTVMPMGCRIGGKQLTPP
ncbi:MAG: PA14 domain-containing protein [Verrucomicrobiota bacterium]